ncbi:bifunctional [glutamine synthetase] adenylyltransferase/[glutamine synthetase]-adenylyl-L-tyrosine phosphorylase [Actinomyces bowdenii]|uniref:Bifunctional [glutamine synthetase] adenylyltransferase/[glutamine synthetase]-adenylyl-L-tyrosine phosphorylase n=1 Tax=Actinomyces bowdenii TaxID=131109 RepID=A0A3P1UWQ9_9ACTO|nr:bifunctional [glutamine synthetase] adenylyltransferase/[glutamine synthetase]-adenylyl-L-tyrosine phosphorylase [Actinomyces bowdenii]RRD24793.1 bifunctional [glutamine synthetase] adenylyltransferase/[glutamine synthetase]-adenylyl-L-tyrosine phosphorylase [Actinomyces bowdenii]
MSGTAGRAQEGPLASRRTSPRRRLIRAGFADAARAAVLLEDPALAACLSDAAEPEGPGLALVPELAQCADPDLALLTLVRLAQACAPGPRAAGAAPQQPVPLLRRILTAGEQDPPALIEHRRRLLRVVGYSQALGDFLVAHPERISALGPARAWEAPGAPAVEDYLRGAVVQALEAGGPGPREEAACRERAGARGPAPDGDDPVARATAALRCAYKDRLLAIAADDLVGEAPLDHVPVVGERMSRLVDAALDGALLIARAAVGPPAQDVALAIIAMGKTGAQELNYISDVDVVYVVGPAQGCGITEARLVETGTQIATELARATSATGPEPALWPLDTALRPEGKDGALVRTLDSHLAYYQRWAASWEFQALLKARACAGDAALGAAYEQAIAPLVWQASSRENFVEDARAMRRRVERESGPRSGPDLRIKLGPGGLRDVEFTVQLLQLVHGRADASLRVRQTLAGLEALSAGGYVSRQDAAAMADCYKGLRLLEHRAQLHRLRRTHSMPAKEEDLRRLGRSVHRSLADGPSLRTTFRELRRRVRALHEDIYYRPLLGAAARLSADEMALSPQAARERLEAVGYIDAEGALRHIQALTEGVSRRAAIQRQLLPVIIGWIGQGADPDAGLLSFRKVSEAIGGSHWYLAMLRDSPVAAQRLCQVLSGSHWAAERLVEFPESIAWLDGDAELAARPPAALAEEIAAVLRRRPLSGPDEASLEAQALEAVQAVVRVRAREEVRAALADCLDGIDPQRTATVLSNATDAVLSGAMSVATALVIAQREGAAALAQGPGSHGRWPGALADHAVIAMGRLGGREVGYASDADVLFVHRARAGADEDAAAREADAVARTMVRLLAAARPHALEVDADLRPEGRQGAMSRSLSAYGDYYGRWAQVWERQALLRARACAGDAALGRAFEELIGPLRWAPGGLSAEELREIRRIKARVEAERLPRGVAPARHLKLGPGGLSDVEWSAQILQLGSAGRVEGLRTTSTLEALQAAAAGGLLGADEAGRLAAAWILASRLRSAIVLGTGRASGPRSQALPDAIRDIRLVGRLIGLESGAERQIEDLYRRSARHARAVAETIIFGGHEPTGRPGGADGPNRAGGPGAAIPRAGLDRAGKQRQGPQGDRPREGQRRGRWGSAPAGREAGGGGAPSSGREDGRAAGPASSTAPGSTSRPQAPGRSPSGGAPASPTASRRGPAARRRPHREGPYPWS